MSGPAGYHGPMSAEAEAVIRATCTRREELILATLDAARADARAMASVVKAALDISGADGLGRLHDACDALRALRQCNQAARTK